jgi:SAM-dependent methyltransferase
MSIVARFVVALNRIFPRPLDCGDGTEQAYSQWEYDTGEQVYQRFLRHKLKMTAKRVLDVGCGMGGKTVFYATLNPVRVVAIDRLDAHVKAALAFERSKPATAPVDFAVADAAGLPFADDAFDVVTATDVFEHLADPEHAMAEMARVLRPGGHLLFYFSPHRSPLGSHLFDAVHLPWCHLLVPERILFRAVELALEDEERRRDPDGAHERARERAREMEDYYRNDLNGMTVGRFLAMARAVPSLDLCFLHRKPIKTGLLAPLTRLPLLGELTTTLAVGLFRKST